MAADDETLMDVFIGIQPKPDFLASVDRMADEASKRLIQKFGSIKLPGPQIGGPTVVNVAADQERTRLLKEQETITRKIAEAEERIAKAKSNRGSRNTPAAEEKASKALADAQKEMLRNEEALQALYRQNPYLKQMADVNAIADQILKHSEERKRAEKEQRVLIQQTEQAQLKLNKLQGDGAIRTTQAIVDEARARATAANAEVARRQKSLDEADTPLKTKRRATALGEAQEAARQAEREAADLESKRAASLGRRDEQRANAAKNLADALALQAAGAQRLEQIDARAIVTATELAQKRLLAVQAFEESERKVAEAQAKLSSIQANVGPASLKKQQELNEATEEFNRLQKERSDIGQRLVELEKQLAVVVTETATVVEKAQKDTSQKSAKSAKEIEKQEKILALQKQEEANRKSILEIEKRIEIARRVLGSKNPNTVGAVNQAQRVAELEQLRTDALAEQERLARRIEAIQSDDGRGGGRRGGGRRGGTGGGDDASGLRDAYRAAIRDAEDLRTVTLQIYKSLGETGSPLAQTLEIAKNRVDQILVALRRGSQDRDPLRLEPTIENLQKVRQEIEGNLRGQTISAVFRNSLAQELVSANRAVSEEDQIRFQLRQSLTQGVAFSDKEAIRGATAEVNVAQKEFNRLAQQIDGSQEALDRLIAAYVRLNGVRELSEDQIRVLQSVSGVPIPAMGDTQAGLRAQRAALQADAATRNFSSTNTLSNNAYQLGQAVEDFAVGYSLNGFSGGVRGAANNVAFLLNNLSQSDRFVNSLANGFVKIRGVIPVDQAKQMAERIALSIPLVAGIGSAIAIVVLPKLIDWLESLNDITVGFEDISDRINRDFSDLKFKVELEADERNFLRTIDRAKELREIFTQLGQVAEQSQDKKIDLQKLFGDPDLIRNQESALKQLLESQKFVDRSLSGAKNLRRLADDPNIESVFLTPAERKASDESIRQFSTISDSITSIVRDLREVTEEGQKGIFDTSKMNRVIESFDAISKVYEIVRGSDLAKPELVDSLKATLDATRGTVEDLRKTSQEIDSINVKLIEGVEAARRKTRELAQEQVLIMDVIRGTANEGVLDAFDIAGFVSDQLAVIEKARAEVIRTLEQNATERKSVVDPQAISNADAAASELREALRIETVNQLLLRRKEIEEQINDLQNKRNGKSELTSLEKISQDLIKSQLSVDDESKQAFKDLTDQLHILNTTISILNANISGAGGTLEMATRTVPFGGGSAVSLGAAIDFGAMSFMMRDAVFAGVKEAMQGQQQPVVDELKKVNEGVGKIGIGAQP